MFAVLSHDHPGAGVQRDVHVLPWYNTTAQSSSCSGRLVACMVDRKKRNGDAAPVICVANS